MWCLRTPSSAMAGREAGRTGGEGVYMGWGHPTHRRCSTKYSLQQRARHAPCDGSLQQRVQRAATEYNALQQSTARHGSTHVCAGPLARCILRRRLGIHGTRVHGRGHAVPCDQGTRYLPRCNTLSPCRESKLRFSFWKRCAALRGTRMALRCAHRSAARCPRPSQRPSRRS